MPTRWIGRRPLSIAAAVAVGAALLVGALVVLQQRQAQPRCRLSPALAPTCGAWWGAALDSRDSALTATVAASERDTGRRLDIVHTYHRWDDSFPTAAETRLSGTGHLLFTNWEPVTRADHELRWADIAAGAQDAAIRAEALRLAALGRPLLLSFSHEPELDYRAHGGLSDYAAAFRHVVTLSRRSGATNVRWVWDLMGLSDPVWRSRYPAMWPGADYVDWIGWDPYNAAACKHRPWQSFAQTVEPFYDWLDDQPFAAGKPLMLAEYGTVEGTTPADKPAWFTGVPHTLARLPRLRALVYFDLPAPPANCDWLVTTSPPSARAFAELARNAAFR